LNCFLKQLARRTAMEHKEARMSAKTSYVIRLSKDLYLDSNNNFLTRPLPNLPVYALAGGDLPLSDDTRKTLLRQMLAVLPKDDPRWKTRDCGGTDRGGVAPDPSPPLYHRDDQSLR
jgi:hypothetical protein